MRADGWVPMLEAAYAIEERRADDEWLAELVKAMVPFVPNALGANAYMYDLRSRPMKLWSMVAHESPLPSEVLSVALATATDEYIENSWKRIPAGTAAEVPGFDEQPALDAFFRPRGVEDVFSVNAYNPSGVGCTIGHPLSRRLKLGDAERARWSRVSSHIAAAFRLRMRLSAANEAPEAVLSPDGKTLHAEGSATLESARESLRHATARIERLRSTSGEGADAAIDEWPALVSARWTLVDRFENDGKRYVVARVNEASSGGNEHLTPRERQVVSLLALGHHPKLVAYELGISHATVRVLMARAARRLGARSRDELIRRATKSSDDQPR